MWTIAAGRSTVFQLDDETAELIQSRYLGETANQSNPDGSIGVDVHIDYGQGSGWTGGNAITSNTSYIDINATPSLAAAYMAPERVGYFRYGVLGWDTNVSGTAFYPGWTQALRKGCNTDPWQMAAVYVHELGHNMGLGHGGLSNSCNYKLIPLDHELPLHARRAGASLCRGRTAVLVIQRWCLARPQREQSQRIRGILWRCTCGLETAMGSLKWRCCRPQRSGSRSSNLLRWDSDDTDRCRRLGRDVHWTWTAFAHQLYSHGAAHHLYLSVGSVVHVHRRPIKQTGLGCGNFHGRCRCIVDCPWWIEHAGDDFSRSHLFAFKFVEEMPEKPPEDFQVMVESFEQLVATLHGIWVVWMPILCLVGVFWVVCGVLLGFGGRQWRTLSLVAVGCALVWTLGYSYASLDFIDAFQNYGESFPMFPSFLSGFWTFSAFFGFAVFLLKPLVVGYIVWRA